MTERIEIIDRFEAEESHLAFPCSACKHRHGSDVEMPCRACEHNLNATDEPLNSSE